MKKAFKFIIGLILLPAAFYVFLGILDLLWILLKNFKITLYFLLGGILYFLFHFFVYDFSRMYVLAHEFTHALAAWLSGYKVNSVSVGESSGQVKVSGVNFFVVLAPYIIPLYSVALTLFYFIITLLFPSATVYRGTFLALLGFFTVLHLVHTYKSLTETEQNDIKMAGGGLFSFSLIVLINAVVILLLLELIFPGLIPIWTMLKDLVVKTYLFWQNTLVYLYKLIKSAGNF
ncbi:MAG: M50 family metallopeptidase [Elusimicrobiota bacterium]|jgi:hypothetical protein|nr:M50 family metallopeptidase [Elusimicrobiota bacterium]